MWRAWRSPRPQAGVYIVRVRGAAVPQGPQPFALAARAREIGDAALGVPALQPIAGGGPLLALSWSAIAGATFYQVEQSDSSDFADVHAVSRTAASAKPEPLGGLGTHWFRVRACTAAGCGAASGTRAATVTSAPKSAVSSADLEFSKFLCTAFFGLAERKRRHSPVPVPAIR